MPLLFKNSFYGFVVLVTLFWPATSLPQHSSRDDKGVSLALSLKAPPSVNDVSGFTITGTLKNKGNKDIVVVKDPNGILYDFFTADALEFERTDSKEEDAIKPSFVGYMAKWNMKTYLQAKLEEDGYPSDDEEDEVDQTGDTKLRSNRRLGRASSDSDSSDPSSPGSDESHRLHHTDTGFTGFTSFSESEPKNYPPGTTIDFPAGKTITFSYKAGEVYDFSKSGAGAYTFKLKRDFLYVLVDDEIMNANVKVDVTPNTVKIQGKLEAGIPEEEDLIPDKKVTADDKIEDRNIEKRAKPRIPRVTTYQCNEKRALVIDRAAKEADKYVQESNKYMGVALGKNEATPRYEHWFGDWNTKMKIPYYWEPKDQVASMYKSLSERSFRKSGSAGGYTYTCMCDQSIHAYVRWKFDLTPPKVAIIHLCQGFRSITTPMKGSNSKAGTLIHESTHFTFHTPRASDHTGDHTDGSDHPDDIDHPDDSDQEYHELCHDLARDDPFLAATNSDNYQFFSENVPTLD